jgi:hypothetical protein
MPASAAATIPPEQMIKGGKNQVTPLLIIMKPFDQHFLLRWKTVIPCQLNVFIDLPQTILTQTIKIGLRQESSRLRRDCHRTALTIGNIPHFTRKGLLASRAIFLFVPFHQAIG